jgi:hypothetical protein
VTTWFLNLPFDEYIDNTKAQNLNFESKTHEAQLENQKPKKISRRSSRRRRNHKTSKWQKSGKPKQKHMKAQNEGSNSKLPLNKLNVSSSP